MKPEFQIMRQNRDFIRGEGGGALAELAILVPFLAVMLAGVAEFGRFFQNYSTLAKGTRTASRYLSNHQLNTTEFTRAKSLVVCGKLVCGVSDPALATGFTAGNVCIETVGSPKVTSVTVRIPRVSGNCGSTATAQGGTASSVPYTYQPIFDVGALLRSNLSLRLPIAPSTTMYYMID
jgi:Flp pilus assembly protein TadG